MMIKNNYYYELTDKFGTIEVNPIGESEFEISYEKEDEYRFFFNKNFSAKIIFNGIIYRRLKKLEKSYYQCDEYVMNVFKKCNSGIKEILSIQFKLTQAEWDDSKGLVYLKAMKKDIDKCLQDNKNEKINLFQHINKRYSTKAIIKGGGVFEIKVFEHEIDAITDYNTIGGYIWNSQQSPELGNWSVKSHEKYIMSPFPILQNLKAYRGRTTWVREIVKRNINDTCPDDWILLETNLLEQKKIYAKKAKRVDRKDENGKADKVEFFIESWKILGLEDYSGKKLDNGMKLKNVLECFTNKFCSSITIVSDFFQINPENISEINYVTGEKSTTNEILVFQKSDVKRPDTINNATKAEISFEKLIESLNKMFNVAYTIENGVFRLEHISWFNRNTGLDLTQKKYEKYVKGKNKYTYINNAIPKYEVFEFKEFENENWNTEIMYEKCSSGKNSQKYTIDEFTTDIEYVMDNSDKDSSKVRDEGFVILATEKIDKEYFIITDETEINYKLNNVFSFKNLVLDFHLHNRYLQKGKINGNYYNFISVKPNKKGEKMLIPLCCDDEFDANDIVVTELGNGFVDKANFSFLTNMLELNIMYNGYEGLIENSSPSIVGGDIITNINTEKIFNLTFSDDNLQSVEIFVEEQPQNGTAQILQNSKILFTPNLDFVGFDTLKIGIKDEWNEIAFANFNVNVKSGVPEDIIANDDNYLVIQGVQFQAQNSIFDNDTGDTNFVLNNYNVVTNQGVSITINNDGKFQYLPPSGFDGVDYFDYSLVKPSSQVGNENTARVYLDVIFINKPIAVEDVYSTKKNTNLSVVGLMGQPKLIENDYSLDGVNYQFTTTPETKSTTNGGTVQIFANGNFNYTPEMDFIGTDSFTYEVNNVNGSDIGNAEVIVTELIYVKLKYNEYREAIYANCENSNQISLIEENGMAFLGWSKTRNFYVEFYKDADGTIPFDVTGLNFKVNFKIDVNTNGNNVTNYYVSDVMQGNSSELINNVEVYRDLKTCQTNNGTKTSELNIINAINYETI